jgi:phage tail sheath protein FI
MPSYVSPGVYVIEKDWSDYTPSLNSTNVGIMGFASQGPTGKATLITNADQLLTTFGRPDDVVGGQGLIGAYHILDRTNTVYFTRVNTTDAEVADVATHIGNCPHVKTSTAIGSDSYHFFAIEVEDGAGNSKTGTPLFVSVLQASSYFSGASGADAVAAAVNQATSPTSPYSFRKTAAEAGHFIGSYAGSGASIKVWGWSSTNAFPTVPAGTAVADLSSFSGTTIGDAFSATDGNMEFLPNDGWQDGAAANGGVQSSALTLDPTDASGGAYVTRTLYPGAGYNYSSTVETYGVKITGLQDFVVASQGPDTTFNLLVGGGAEESNLVQMVKSTTGIDLNPEAVINNTADETNKTSDFIIGEFAIDNADRDDVLWTVPSAWGGGFGENGAASLTVITPSGSAAATTTDILYGKLVDGTYNFAGGVNGDLSGRSFSDEVVKAAVIGSAAENTGVYSYLKEDVDISILAIPGCTEQNIVNNAISIAESSQEYLFVTNPPFGISTPQNAIAWSNGVAEGRTAALNSSYAAVYWPWVKLFNPFTRVDEYVSPDIFAIRQMAFTDANFDAWFAPAGLVRGRLTKPVDVEVVLTQGDRDALYGPGNIINPVQKFLTEGIVLWGQRTTQRTATALDRINVRRLMIIIRKMLLASTRQFVFEPNDAATWKRVTNAVEPLMADIKSRRGVVDFKVICDATTNTPIRIDRNELWCKVILQPTKAAEVIVFELNLTSATLGLDLPTT